MFDLAQIILPHPK